MRTGVKVFRAAAIFLGIFGLAIWSVDWYIAEMSPAQRPAAWLWFVAGWITAAVAVALLMLPMWIRGKMVPNYIPTAEEIQANVRGHALMGGVLCLFSGSLGVIGPSLALGLGALGCGAVTAGLGYVIALHTTAKGRAMLDQSRG